MEFSAEQKLWAGLLGYCGDPELARQHLHSEYEGAAAFAAAIQPMDRSLAEGPRIVDFTGIEGDIPAIRSAIESLAAHSPMVRSQLLANVLFGPEVSGRVAERRDQLRADLGPLLESGPLEPPGDTGPSAAPLFVIALGLVVGLAGVVWLGGGSNQAASPPAAPSTTIERAMSPEPVVVELADLVADPGRVLDVSLGADGVVVRRDPATAAVVWRSRPYADANDLRVDGDVVTVARSSGWTTYLNLADGTQLPP